MISLFLDIQYGISVAPNGAAPECMHKFWPPSDALVHLHLYKHFRLAFGSEFKY